MQIKEPNIVICTLCCLTYNLASELAALRPRRGRRLTSYTANSIKVVLSKPLIVNYERSRDDGLLLIFPFKHGIMSAKHLRGHMGNLRRQIYLLQR